jgi:hypothetical protein
VADAELPQGNENITPWLLFHKRAEI